MTTSSPSLNPKRVSSFSVLLTTVSPKCQAHSRYDTINIWLQSPILFLLLLNLRTRIYLGNYQFQILYFKDKFRPLDCWVVYPKALSQNTGKSQDWNHGLNFLTCAQNILRWIWRHHLKKGLCKFIWFYIPELRHFIKFDLVWVKKEQ